jgi:hypothetical protein
MQVRVVHGEPRRPMVHERVFHGMQDVWAAARHRADLASALAASGAAP